MAARMFVKSLVLACVVLALGAGIFALAARQAAIAPIARPAASSFDADLVKRGAELAAIGNCVVCHTAPGGREFAGGRALPTPFGTIYSTNITPDIETGIGGWSSPAFLRAMRRGVRRDGAYLYPAFPYDHFTLVSDSDNDAIYAFLMTREAVRATPPANQLPFPLRVRMMMTGWNLLFLHPGPFRPDSNHDETWNRGAYLVEGLGHCGACHTPRNVLAAEKSSERLSGGETEGWTAYALNEASPAPAPWTADALTSYLLRGFHDSHGIVLGPMTEVANVLHGATPQDIRAMAVYLATQLNRTGASRSAVAPIEKAQSQRGKVTADNSADSQAVASHADDRSDDEGALIYVSACASCHEGPRAMPFGGLNLALSSATTGPNPNNLFNVVLYGLPAAGALRAPIMPGFASTMNDAQVLALARYLRSHFTNQNPWSDIEASLRDARSDQRAATVRSAPNIDLTPTAAMQTGAMQTGTMQTGTMQTGTMQRSSNEAQR
jgi:mono/diheme cytochrome c family protein